MDSNTTPLSYPAASHLPESKGMSQVSPKNIQMGSLASHSSKQWQPSVHCWVGSPPHSHSTEEGSPATWTWRSSLRAHDSKCSLFIYLTAFLQITAHFLPRVKLLDISINANRRAQPPQTTWGYHATSISLWLGRRGGVF